MGVDAAERPDAVVLHQARRDRRLRLLAVAIAAVALVLCLATLVLWWSYVRRGVDVQPPSAEDLVLGSLFPVAGAVVLWRQPRNACGWVLLSASLVAVSALAHAWAAGAVAEPGSLPVVPLAVWLSAWTYIPYWLQGTLLPVLFPDGRLPSPRWRPYVRAVLAVVAVLTFVAMFKPDSDVEDLGLSNPLGLYALPIPMSVWGPVQHGSVMLLFMVATPVALIGMVMRTRQARGRERAQLLWLLLGLSVLPVWAALSWLLPALSLGPGLAIAFACIPISMAIAVLRHSLLDIEVVVNRTVVYAVLTGAGLLAYVGLVALAGRYVSSDGAGPVVAAVVVAAAAAGRTRLQALVDRRLFGSRRDPYAVVQQVRASTAAAAEPGQALTALVEAVRSALRLPFVQVLDASGAVAAESGVPVAGTHVVPIVDGGRSRGVLVVGRRTRRERLHAEEASALVDVAHRAGGLLSAQALLVDLRRSYDQVVRVRQEERARLRRDLHDGVGPSLAGVALQLEGLVDRLGDDGPLAARAELARQRLLSTVGEVRRIVDGLRPAAVEQLGLEAALRGLATHEGDPVQVAVDVDLPDVVPPGVEVAVYRIAGEAVTNALRHAQASAVSVCVRRCGDDVRVEVVDDGCGLAIPVQPGVGLRSMQERAQQVGGSVEVGPTPTGGTRVLALLPATDTAPAVDV